MSAPPMTPGRVAGGVLTVRTAEAVQQGRCSSRIRRRGRTGLAADRLLYARAVHMVCCSIHWQAAPPKCSPRCENSRINSTTGTWVV
jgi:hypothetical protein